MVREFARNIVTLRAFNEAGRKVRVEKTDKHTWQAAPVNGALTLRYEVYAWDMSVRAAHLDDTTGFFNGTSVFLAAVGHEEAPCRGRYPEAGRRGLPQLARRDRVAGGARHEALRLRRVPRAELR